MEIVEAADEIMEELFPPRPGGLVDRHRRRKAEEAAYAEEIKNAREPIEQPSYKAIKVAPQSPESISAQTVTIAPGGRAPLLPNSPYRFRATILLITAAATVILTKDDSQGLGGTGFMLPSGIPVPVYSRAQMGAYNPGGAAIQVSVLSEIYAPESKA